MQQRRSSPAEGAQGKAPAHGLVVSAHGRHYLVETIDGGRRLMHPRGKKAECVVGDLVRWQPTGDQDGVIEGVEPRRNLLMRQDNWRTKSFAANIDLLLMLVAVEPGFSESQLTRALVAADAAGIPVCIGLNKIDLPAADAARERLAPYRAMGIAVVELALKAQPEAARHLLQPLLQGTTLLLGPSGAGKSTLINLLLPDAGAQVGEISRALNSGRHTTTHTRWYWLPSDDTGATAAGSARHALIDTPGFQEFGLHHIAPDMLAQCMPDLRPHLGACRFYNCTHCSEPDCGVARAVQHGDIAASRWRLYKDIHAELNAATAH